LIHFACATSGLRMDQIENQDD